MAEQSRWRRCRQHAAPTSHGQSMGDYMREQIKVERGPVIRYDSIGGGVMSTNLTVVKQVTKKNRNGAGRRPRLCRLRPLGR